MGPARALVVLCAALLFGQGQPVLPASAAPANPATDGGSGRRAGHPHHHRAGGVNRARWRRVVTDTVAIERPSPAGRSGQEAGQGAVFGDRV